jgi:hypothetical protein
MEQGFFARLIVALGNAFGDVAELFGDADNFEELLTYFGQPGGTLPRSYETVAQQAVSLQQAVAGLLSAPGATSPSYEHLGQVTTEVAKLITAIEAISDAPGGISDPTFLATFKQQLVGLLVVAGLKNHLPAAYYLASALGVVTSTGNSFEEDGEDYEKKEFNLANFKLLLSQPATYLPAYLGWKESFTLSEDLQQDLSSFIQALGGAATVINRDATVAEEVSAPADPEARGMLHLSLSDALGKVLAISLLPEANIREANYETIVDPDTGEEMLDPQPSATDSLMLNLLSAVAQTTPLSLGNNIELQFADFSNSLRFKFGPTGLTFADGTELSINTLHFDPAVALTYMPDDPLLFIGEPNKTRLQADGVQLALALSVDKGVKLELKLVNSQFVIKGSEGDSFLSSVLPDSTIAVPLSVTLSSADGLRFNGTNSFRLKSSPHRAIGPVLVDQLTLGLESTAEHDVAIRAHSDLVVSLGPVKASASDVGVSFTIKELTNPKDIAFGFDLPKGIGIAVESDLITGGGYLLLDPANHKYAGVANLTLKTSTSDINLNALGLLQTELPGNPDAYSLLLLITAQFTPIQLGLGFTLNGLGGLVGVNRAADTDYLRGMVRRGEVKRLLFPANVLDDPAGTLALVDAAFPATEGRYIIGLLGELGWGTPNLITLDVALLLEFPAPLKVLLLGVLQVVLPDENANTLKLRADFLGFVDFGAKKASFDASLSNSHILSFTLTGDMAFRLYQGTNPLFVITAGGFHPAFQPPAGAALTGLRRLTLALSQSDNLQLTLASYFAVTSNTVQFGSHLDLYLRICRGLTVEGHFGFDVLFQFQPFRMLAHVEAGVAVKSGSHELLSVHLSLDVTGPGPWHVWGEASFRLLFIKISFDVNATIGDPATAPATLPAPNVHEQLVAALKDPTSWAVEVPSMLARPNSVTLRPANSAAGELFIDPRGTLVVRQRVAPLGVKLEKYGSSNVAPTGGQRFDLLGIILGDNDLHDGSEVEATKEFFAPDQYRVLTDGQKLSLPSFQSLTNGVRLKRLTGLKAAAKATRRIVEYEKKQLNGSSIKVKPGVDTFQKLAQGGTLGRAVRAEQPSARVPKPMGWTEDTYEVVHAADLSNYDAAHQQFGSQVEAEQYRLALADAAELLVVPSYQLALA